MEIWPTISILLENKYTEKENFHVLVLQPKYQQVPEQSTEASRTDEASFTHILSCVNFIFDQKKILPFLFSGVRLSELPVWENGDSERTEKDIFDFQEEEEDGDAPRNGKYTLKSVKKIDHYSRLVIFGENI